MVVMIILSSALMFHAESAAQPDRFPNIPAAPWWAVAALTTVGYGDLYPVTNLGRAMGGVIAILGIGLIAMPSGIISMGLIKEAGLMSRKSINLTNVDSLKRFYDALGQIVIELPDLRCDLYDVPSSTTPEQYGRAFCCKIKDNENLYFWIGKRFSSGGIYFSVARYKDVSCCPGWVASVLLGLPAGIYFNEVDVTRYDIHIPLKKEHSDAFFKNIDIREQKDILKKFVAEVLGEIKESQPAI